jgi:hypothetical protein
MSLESDLWRPKSIGPECSLIFTIIMHSIFMDPCIVDYSLEIPTRCSFVIEFIIPKFIEGSTCLELLMMSGVPLETC